MDRNDPRYTEGFVGRVARGIPVTYTTHLTKRLTLRNRLYNWRANRRSERLGVRQPTVYEVTERYVDCSPWAYRVSKLSNGEVLRREQIHRNRWTKIVPGHPKFF